MSLVSAERIKQIVAISKNIDDNIINPYIILAELKYVKPVLGQLLYPDIVAKFDNQTLNQIETTLVEMVQIPLAHYVIENALTFLTYSITEKGIQSQYGVNSETPDSKSTNNTLNYVRNEISNNAEYFTQEVNKFLEANQASFPLYTASGNLPDNIPAFDSQIAFYPATTINTRSYFL